MDELIQNEPRASYSQRHWGPGHHEHSLLDGTSQQMDALYKLVQQAHVSFYPFVLFGRDDLPVEVSFQGSISLSASEGLLGACTKHMALSWLDAVVDIGGFGKSLASRVCLSA